MNEVDELICAVLRDETLPWPEGKDDAFISLFLQRSSYHGVQALLHDRLSDPRRHRGAWPKPVLDACRDAAVGQAMWEMRHREILGKTLSRLAEIGVRPIIFKGTALAYSAYPTPFLRTRGDTDFIIPAHARTRVSEALMALEYRCEVQNRGDLISYTEIYAFNDPNTGLHEIDLHWRISNSQVLSKLFSYDELAASAAPLPALGRDAYAPSPTHALAIACMHRAGHQEAPYFVDGQEHYGGDRLIWFYDMHLLSKAWRASDYEIFLEYAKQKGLTKICLEGLEEARRRFGSGIPAELADKYRIPGAAEPVSLYLASSPLRQLYANLSAVEGYRDKARYLLQVFFPPENYMRWLYPDVRPDWLPWLHLYRITTTVAKRLGRTLARRLDSGGQAQG